MVSVSWSDKTERETEKENEMVASSSLGYTASYNYCQNTHTHTLHYSRKSENGRKKIYRAIRSNLVCLEVHHKQHNTKITNTFITNLQISITYRDTEQETKLRH